MFSKKEAKTDLDRFLEFVESCGFSTATTSDGSRRIVKLSGRSTDGKICYDDPLVSLGFDSFGMLELGDEWFSDERYTEVKTRRESEIKEAAEAEQAEFDSSIAQSIKRLSESGQIASSSGNAINVKDTSDKQAAKAEFFGDGEAIGGSAGGFVHFADHGSNSADLTREEWLNALRAGHFSGDPPRLEPDEELPHTLPPHIMRMVKEASDLEAKRDALQSYINGNDECLPDDNRVNVRLRAEQVVVMSSYHKILKDRIANETLKHFGGES